METEIRFEPTLFIFLGTSPAQIGWRLKQLLKQAYGDVPVLRYLWVDADQTIDPAAAHWFSQGERAELAGFNGDDVLANLNMYPAIRSWWPVESRLKPGYVRRGANQVRLHGRLSLFRMFNDRTSGPAFIDKLRGHLEALQQIEHYDATERLGSSRDGRMRYVVERGSLRVVIFFSTCGGTGSSMSFDVAYLCRYLLRNSNPTIQGIALLPPVMDKAIKNETHTQWEKIRANTYAWFKEHEYLLENPYWRVAYPEGAPVNIQAPPFDLTFLVDIGNQAGDRLSTEDDIFSMAAQAIFLDTGSSIGGAIRGFNANVSVLMDEFMGRQRAYSALAAASLVYPADKILDYCSDRLGQEMIRKGLLAQAGPQEAAEAASALVGRLGWNDETILAALLADRQIPNLNGPAVRKAASAGTALNLLLAQENQDLQERQHQVRQIAQQATAMLEGSRRAFLAEVSQLVLERGVLFAQAVLDALTADPGSLSGIGIGAASLRALKIRLAEQGVGEDELNQAKAGAAAAQEKLRGLEGEVWQSLWRALARKSWQQELDRARSDSLHWQAEANRLVLQLAAQNEAANLYNQLIDLCHSCRSSLAGLAQSAARAEAALEASAQERLKPAGLEQGIYELSLEAVGPEYNQAYFRTHASLIDPAAAYAAFARSFPIRRTESGVAGKNPADLSELVAWDDADLARGLQTHARGYFASEIENISLLDALATYHGENAPAEIEALFDRLVRYCHPFWQYRRDSGIGGQEGKSLVGVEDEHSELIPEKYRDSLQYEIKSTGFKHRIDVARVQHGLPAFLLRGMEDYQAFYEARRKGIDPMHVILEAAQAAEVAPEERQEARRTFALACAFGYIVQIGSWYYFDPRKEYASHHIHPGRENRLGQGRENAEDAFVQRDDLVQEADELIEAEIVSMGNRAATALLESQVSESRQALANMGATSNDNGLRRQFEKEIRALIEKQRQLGHLGQTAGVG